MGNIFAQPGTPVPNNNTVTDSEVANLKLEAAKITEFLGRIEDFQAWKIRTECAFDGSGVEKVLTDRTFAQDNPRMNRIVFSQLSVATANGDAYHLVLKHNEMKDGNGAWKELLEWYDGDAGSGAKPWMTNDQGGQPEGRPIRRLETVRLTQGGYIKPPKGSWYTDYMPDEHKSFVQEWNSKVAHGEDTNQVSIPSGITILPPRNKWAQKARRLADQTKGAPVTPSPIQTGGKRAREEATPPLGNKRINFNVDSLHPNKED